MQEQVVIKIESERMAKFRELVVRKYGRIWGKQSKELLAAVEDRMTKLEAELGEGTA